MTALCLCDRCGRLVEMSDHDAALMPRWEAQLGRLVVHCLECASDFIRSC